jgi:hypothetical protein
MHQRDWIGSGRNIDSPIAIAKTPAAEHNRSVDGHNRRVSQAEIQSQNVAAVNGSVCTRVGVGHRDKQATAFIYLKG